MAYIYDLTDTWNAGGTTFNAIKMNVTDSASAAGSKLVTLQTNGTEHFSVTKAGVGYFSGNVGIGTLSPNAKLTVAGAITSYQAGVTDQIIFTPQTAGSGALLLAVNEANNAYRQMTIDGSPVVINTAGTEKVRVLSNGNVGIGTSSPASPLEVYNASGGWIRFGNAGGTGEVFADGSATLIGSVSNHPLLFRIGSAEKVRISTAGFVGIGTSSPSAKLTVNDANGIPVRIGDISAAPVSQAAVYVGASTSALSGGNGDLVLIPRTSDARSIVFYTGNGTAAERARIDSSGNLLVGTTSAVSRSSVSSRFISVAPSGLDAACVRQGENTSFALVSHVSTTSGTRYHIGFGDGASWTERGTITTDGTSTSYNTSSDARLKENIADADNASSLIDAIRVRKFDWKATGSHQRYGMIAQELLEVAPEAVSHDPDDEEKMMGVDYSKLVPMLVKEIQSLRARVAQLEGN